MDRVCNLIKQDKYKKVVIIACIISLVGIMITMYNYKYSRYAMAILGSTRGSIKSVSEPKSKFILTRMFE